MITSGLNHLAHTVLDSQKTNLTREDIKKIYEAYPSGYEENIYSKIHMTEVELYASIGGPLGDWFNDVMTNDNLTDDGNFGNTCATRLSKALNDAGFKIPKSRGTFEGANNKHYYIKAQSMYNYLNRTIIALSLNQV